MPLSPDAVPLVVAFVALVVGLLGAGVSTVAILQKRAADRRNALWDRSKFAITMSHSSSPVERLLGTDMILMLLDQDELPANDAALLRLAALRAVGEGVATQAGADEFAAMRQSRPVRSGRETPPADLPMDKAVDEAQDDGNEGKRDV
ncbi:MAG: hypothetical protein WD794_05960 [Mycobacteriales bacterium]